jgi:hypothetical protein
LDAATAANRWFVHGQMLLTVLPGDRVTLLFHALLSG